MIIESVSAMLKDATSVIWIAVDVGLMLIMLSSSLALIRFGLIWAELIYLFSALFIAGISSPGMLAVVITGVLFVAVNILKLVMDYKAKSISQIAPRYRALYLKHFKLLSPKEFRILMDICETKTIDGLLLKKGSDFSSIYFLLKGKVLVKVERGDIEVSAHTFLGEMAYFDQENTVLSADVITDGEATFLMITNDDLMLMEKKFEGFTTRFNHILALDVVQKLTRMNRAH